MDEMQAKARAESLLVGFTMDTRGDPEIYTDAIEAVAQALLSASKPPAGFVRPHRAIEIDIHIGADNWADALADLKDVYYTAEERGVQYGSVMGGPSSGHTVTITQRPEQTNEKYHDELKAYLAAKEVQGG